MKFGHVIYLLLLTKSFGSGFLLAAYIFTGDVRVDDTLVCRSYHIDL